MMFDVNELISVLVEAKTDSDIKTPKECSTFTIKEHAQINNRLIMFVVKGEQ